MKNKMNKTKFKLRNIEDLDEIESEASKCFLFEKICLFLSCLFLITSLFWIQMVLLAILFICLTIMWLIERRYWCMKHFLINRFNKKK